MGIQLQQVATCLIVEQILLICPGLDLANKLFWLLNGLKSKSTMPADSSPKCGPMPWLRFVNSKICTVTLRANQPAASSC